MQVTTKLILGDCLDVLKTMPSDSVHAAITSPPYWALRDYGVDGQIGLERTFPKFIAELVAVFSEVRRVLHPSGTCWVNMGDSYNSAATRGTFGDQSNHGYETHGVKRNTVRTMHPKNRLGQPWKLAFALQDDGWILRDEIIWHKPNPMPSSVDDRTTPAHEQLFLLSKKPVYFFDAWSIKEPSVSDHSSGNGFARAARLSFQNSDGTPRGNEQPWQVQNDRAKRSVWSIPTEPCPEAHFATYPQKLVEPCIKSGSSERGCCPDCLAPWRRTFENDGITKHGGKRKRADAPGAEVSETSVFRTGEISVKKATGWAQGCKCMAAAPIPSTILDPFSGSGTTGIAASKLFRNYIGIELNPEYLEMSRQRLSQGMSIFNTIEVLDYNDIVKELAPF